MKNRQHTSWVVLAAVGICACGTDSVWVTATFNPVDGRSITGAEVRAKWSLGDGQDFDSTTVDSNGRFDLEVPPQFAGAGAIDFLVSFQDGVAVGGSISVGGRRDVDAGEIPVWSPGVAATRIDNADRLTWSVPEQLRDQVRTQVIVDSTRYHLGLYNDVDRSIDIPDWTLEDADPVGHVGFRVPAVYPLSGVILYAAPVELPAGSARSLAAGLPCSVVIGGTETTISDCIYTAGVDATVPEDPPPEDPLADCRYSVDACPSWFSVDLGQVRQVRRIALRGLQVEALLGDDSGAIMEGDRPQFVVAAGAPTSLVAIAYVTMQGGVELLELPEPVETRYIGIGAFGQMDAVGSVGVFE